MSTHGSVTFRVDGTDKSIYVHADAYPQGLGLDLLRFLRQLVKDGDAAITAAADRVRELRMVGEDDRPASQDIAAVVGLGVPLFPNGAGDYYDLLRPFQHDPDALLSLGFAAAYPDGAPESWDGDYVIDFDAREFLAGRDDDLPLRYPFTELSTDGEFLRNMAH